MAMKTTTADNGGHCNTGKTHTLHSWLQWWILSPVSWPHLIATIPNFCNLSSLGFFNHFIFPLKTKPICCKTYYVIESKLKDELSIIFSEEITAILPSLYPCHSVRCGLICKVEGGILTLCYLVLIPRVIDSLKHWTFKVSHLAVINGGNENKQP